MAYTSDSTLHRDLDDNEEQEFRKWARDNFNVLNNIEAFWHPVIKQECQIMIEQYQNSLNALNKEL